MRLAFLGRFEVEWAGRAGNGGVKLVSYLPSINIFFSSTMFENFSNLVLAGA